MLLYIGERAEKLITGKMPGIVTDGFTSEQVAILRLLEMVEEKEGSGEIERGGSIFLLTDSQSNISSLKSPRCRDERERKIRQALCRLCCSGRKVTLRFVKAHRGLIPNEICDTASKMERGMAEAKYR